MRHVKRLLVTMLVVAMILSTAGIASATLNDVAGTRFEESVTYLEELGVVAGYPDGSYKPEATITRAEAVKIIIVMRYGNSDLANLLKGASPFPDVPGTHWASGYISLAKNAGIVNGYPDGTFKPDALVTYAEFAKMLCEAAGLEPLAGLSWPANYVGAAQAAGMLEDVPDFLEGSPAIRGDCAIMAAYTVQEVENPVTGKTLAESVFGLSAVASVEVTTAEVSLAVGQSQAFTAVLKDSAGEVIADETVSWSSTGGVIDSEGNFVASAAGLYTVTATIGDLSATATVTVYGAATKIALSAPAEMVANAKSNQVLTATALDANGAKVANFTGKIKFQVTGPAQIDDNGTLVSIKEVSAVAGEASVKIVASGTGSASTAVVVTTSTGLTGANVTITINKPVVNKFVATTDVSLFNATSAAQATMTITAYDQEGVKFAAGKAVTLKLTSSDTNVIKFAGAAGDGTLTVNFSAVNSTQTVTLLGTAVPGTAVISGTPDTANASVLFEGCTVTTVIAGNAAKFDITSIPGSKTVGATVTFKVAILDQNGAVLTNKHAGDVGLSTASVDVWKDGSKTTNYNGGLAITTDQNGIVTFTWSNTAASNAGNYEVVVKGATTMAQDSATFDYLHGDPASVKLSASPTVIAGDGSSKAVLTATVVDAYGNTCKSYTGNITIAKDTDPDSAANLTLPATTEVAAVEGKATFEVTATNTFGTDTFKATAKHNDVTLPRIPANVSVSTQLVGPAYKIGLSLSAGTATVGNTVKVYVDVQDFNGNRVTADNSTLVVLEITDGTGTIENAAVTVVNGRATFKVSATKTHSAGDFVVKATAGTLVNTGATASITWTAGDPASIKVSANATTLATGSNTTLSAKYVDEYGNTAAGTPALTNIKVDPASAGTVAGMVFTAGAYPATATLTFEDAGAAKLPCNTLTITIVTVGEVYRLAFDSPSAGTVGVNKSVYVRFQDYLGQTMTGMEGGVPAPVDVTKLDGPGALTITQSTYVDGVVKVVLNTTTAGTYSLKAAGVGFDPALQTASVSVTFVAEEADHMIVTADPFELLNDGSSVALISAVVRDVYGNPDKTYVNPVTFSITSPASPKSQLLATSATPVNGVASVYLQSGTVVETVVVQAKTTFTGALTPTTATVSVPIKIAVSTIAVDLGDPADVKIGDTTRALTATAYALGGVQKVVFDYDAGSGWTVIATDTVAPYETTWDVTGLPETTVSVRATLTSYASTTATDTETMVVDWTAPVVTAFSGTTPVAVAETDLSITATGTPVYMAFRNAGGSWSSWYTYAATHDDWALAAPDGDKTIDCKVKDAVGNESAVVSTVVVLATGAPTGTIAVNSGATYTDNLAVTLDLTYSAGATQMCFSNDGSTWSGWEAVGASKAWNLAAGADGLRTAYVKYRNVALVESSAYSDAITYDGTAPVIAFTFTTPTNVDPPAVTGTVTDATSGVNLGTFVLWFNGGVVVPTWAGNAFSYTPGAALGDGPYAVQASVDDNAGNPGNNAGTIVVDATPPVGHTITVPAYSNVLGITATLTYPGDAVEMNLKVGGGSYMGWEAVAGAKALTLPATDQVYVISFKVRDAALNESAEATDSVELDRVIPAIAITAPAAGYVTSAQPAFTADASDVGGSGVAQVEFWVAGALEDTDTTAAYACSWPASSLVEGTATNLVAVAVDNAGNSHSIGPVVVTYDGTVPVIAGVSDYDTNDSTPTISTTWSDVHTAVDAGSALITVGGVDVTSLCTLSGSGFSYTPTLPLADNAYAVTVDVDDLAGNSAVQATWTVTVDTVAPAAPVAGSMTVAQNPPLTDDTVTGAGGAVEANATVNIYSDAGLTTLVVSGAADGLGAFGPLSIGDNLYGTVYVTATDAAGNESTGTAMTNDIAAPAAPVAVSMTVTQNPPLTNDTVAGAAGAVEASATVNIYSDAGLTTLVVSGAAAADGSFAALSIGDNLYGTVYVTATDAAGNESTGTAMTNDIAGPVLLSITFNPGGQAILTFSEAINVATITGPTIDTDLPLSTGGDTWAPLGGGFALAWSGGNTVLTITPGVGNTITSGSTIDPAVTVTDVYGNADATTAPGPAVP